MSFKEKIKCNEKIFSNIKEREDFPILIRQMGYKKICEVGVFAGYFTKVLSLSSPDHQVVVDMWDKYDAEEAAKRRIDMTATISQRRNMREHVQKWAKMESFRVDVIVDFSENAVKQFEDEYFDFVYIDADHSYEGATADLEAWYPKVRKGGMLAGHDYANVTGRSYIITNNLTKDAIDDFVKRYDKQNSFFITHEVSSLFAQKSFFIVK